MNIGREPSVRPVFSLAGALRWFGEAGGIAGSVERSRLASSFVPFWREGGLIPSERQWAVQKLFGILAKLRAAHKEREREGAKSFADINLLRKFFHGDSNPSSLVVR